MVWIPLGQPVIAIAYVGAGLVAEAVLALVRYFSRGKVAYRKAWRQAYRAHLSHLGNSASYRPSLRRSSQATVPPNQWTCIPDAETDHGYVYVIRFGSGTVKVGKSTEPRQRISQHHRMAAAHNVQLTKVWVSRAHADYSGTEQRLIEFCASRSRRIRREYFDGMDFNAAVNFARQFDGTELVGWGAAMPIEADEAMALIEAARAAHRIARAQVNA
jgi:hypothetical protein